MEKWTFHYLKQTCSVSGKVTSFVMQLKNSVEILGQCQGMIFTSA